MVKAVSPVFNSRADVYTRVTDRIIADLEKGVRPWSKPWNAGNTEGRIIRPLRHDGTPYKGVNVLLLWSEAVDKGYSSPTWMTFKQSQQLGATVRKGEHGSLVVYADRFNTIEIKENGDTEEKQIPFMKGYTVFNTDQIDGLPDKYQVKPETKGEPIELIEHAEMFFASSGATFRHGGNKAYYSPSHDFIQLPPPESFKDAESYAAVKAHELTHWTKHPTRLNRDFEAKRLGDKGYAREELVAEMGAAFLCADLQIAPEPREDHAAYLSSWLEVLKEDKRAIFNAASHAQKAVDYLHSFKTVAVIDEAEYAQHMELMELSTMFEHINYYLKAQSDPVVLAKFQADEERFRELNAKCVSVSKPQDGPDCS